MSRLPAAALLSLLACARAPTELDGPADVLIDAQGVPHIFASSEHDVFFLQGWAAARDRLFQMDMTRRRAQGRRAELLGEDRYLSDVQSRALRFAAWGERTAAALEQEDPRIYAILTAYSDGVNRYLADAVAGVDGAALPEQILALDYVPEPWTPADCMAIEKLITGGLSMRPDQEMTLGLMRALLGPDTFHDLYVYEPFDRDYIAPAWSPEPPVPAPPPDAPPPDGPPSEDQRLRDALRTLDLRALGRALSGLDLALGGSNNWAVDAAHSAGGAAMVFGDSHQGVTHPATYWMVHLNTADAGGALDVVGASFPGTPFVMFGHNGRVAWTPTTSLFDVSDAWLETWADAAKTAVLHDGAPAPVTWRTELFRVSGPDGVEERSLDLLEVPHHGPVLPADALGLPLPVTASLGWTGYQARSTATTYLSLAEARTVDEALAAFNDYFTGGMNWAIGDQTGRIAWTARVDLPERQQLDPDTPPIALLPGTGGYDWRVGDDGLYQPVPASALPTVVDPAEGFLTTANNDPFGQTDDGDPFNDPVYLSAVFDIGTRSAQPKQRLAELAAAGPIPFEAARDVQLDTTSRVALGLRPFLLEAAARRPDLVTADGAELLRRLEAWDGACGIDDTTPSIFHLWLARAAYDVMADEAGGLVGELVFSDMSYQLGLVAVKFLRYWLERTAVDIDRIDAGELPFPSRSGRSLFDDAGTPEVETRDMILLRALAEVPAEAARIFGSTNPDAWRWGDWHTMALVDLADAAVPEASAPALAKAGGLYTVDVGDYSWFVDGAIPAELLVTNAPSNRFAIELTNPVRFEYALPGGESERPGDPHHNDLFADYLNGGYHEMHTERSAIMVEQTFSFGD